MIINDIKNTRESLYFLHECNAGTSYKLRYTSDGKNTFRILLKYENKTRVISPGKPFQEGKFTVFYTAPVEGSIYFQDLTTDDITSTDLWTNITNIKMEKI